MGTRSTSATMCQYSKSSKSHIDYIMGFDAWFLRRSQWFLILLGPHTDGYLNKKLVCNIKSFIGSFSKSFGEILNLVMGGREGFGLTTRAGGGTKLGDPCNSNDRILDVKVWFVWFVGIRFADLIISPFVSVTKLDDPCNSNDWILGVKVRFVWFVGI